MSARLSTGRPRACSGLMYAAVPSRLPWSVPCSSVGESERPGATSSRSSALASPKSSTFTRVKVLDFGLAKSELRDEVAPGLSLSPTELHGTLQGSLLGTAAYMSPEQARGLAVDKRADIWAFGCVLYEMLAGRQAYPGSTMSDRVVAILDREPAWDALPAATPPAVHRTLRRCLEKDVKRRLRDIGDARFEIDEALAAPARDPGIVAGPMRAWRAPQMIAAVVVAAIVAGVTAWLIKPAPRPRAVVGAGVARL